MEWIEGGVTAPKGFRASAIQAGLKKKGPDLSVIECPGEASCAALFTTNRVKAAPIILSMENLRRSSGRARAVVINSGNANACNGPRGLEDARRVAGKCAELLGTTQEKILVASTGVIGRPLRVDRVLSGLERSVPLLSSSREAGTMVARAMMTTDTVPKESAVCAMIGGSLVTTGGMAKGAGMIHPNLATMICVVTTDASVEPDVLLEATRHAAQVSFNMISVDRDTSTNDMLLVMASGASGVGQLRRDSDELCAFTEALTKVCTDLAKRCVKDAEGASKLFEVVVTGATDVHDARICARSIAASNLVKSAVFGCDPNWGRVLAAAGYSGARVDQDRVRVWLEKPDGSVLEWVSNGCQVSEEANSEARDVLASNEFKIGVDLGLGSFSATAWGCDLSYEYVKVNSEYTT